MFYFLMTLLYWVLRLLHISHFVNCKEKTHFDLQMNLVELRCVRIRDPGINGFKF